MIKEKKQIRGAELWDKIEQAAREKNEVDSTYRLVMLDIGQVDDDEPVKFAYYRLKNNAGDDIFGFVDLFKFQINRKLGNQEEKVS